MKEIIKKLHVQFHNFRHILTNVSLGALSVNTFRDNARVSRITSVPLIMRLSNVLNSSKCNSVYCVVYIQ